MVAHFRIIFFAFLSLAAGIWLSELFNYHSMWFLYGTLIVFGILLVFLLLHFCFRKSKFFAYFFGIRWYLLVFAIFIGVGIGLYAICEARYEVQFKPDKNITYNVYGTVDINYITKEKGVYFILDDVYVSGGLNNEVDLEDKVFVYLYYGEDGTRYTEEELSRILPGNRVLISSKLSLTPIFDNDEINSFAYSSGFQYSCFTNLDAVTFIEGEMGFWDSVREHIRNLYKQNMDEKYAGLAFSVLVGDRTELDAEIVNNFQISGIMHVIAVSGLNTAFIMILLLWLLKKLRVNRYMKLGVIIAVLAFYAILCDMTPSVVRSSMMSIFLITAQLFGKQRDDLTSISLSGIILLMLYPLYVFDLSFLLSYLGVFGIFLLYKPLVRLFEKWKLKKLASPLALTIAATLMTAPIVINAFGYFSLIGLIANLVLVPLFGYVFMILFGVTILVLIMPFLAKLLWLLQWGFWVVDKGAMLFAAVPNAAVNLRPIPDWALVGYYTGTFFCSQQCVAKRRLKITLISISMSVFVAGFIISFL